MIKELPKRLVLLGSSFRLLHDYSKKIGNK